MFDKLIEAGMVLQTGQQFSREHLCVCKESGHKQKLWFTELWRSPLKSPTYCHLEEDECTRVGVVEVVAPRGGWPDVLTYVNTLVVGETELTMKLLMKETGEEYETTIDFL